MPSYTVPQTDELDEGHVCAALDFLVAVDPVPTPDFWEEYQAAIRPHQPQITAAMATLRRFAEQTSPMTLERMQFDYHGFTNDPRYLETPEASAVVIAALTECGVGRGWAVAALTP